jgi:sugar phosphate isomerase/epimerase
MKVGVDGNHTVGYKTRGVLKTLDFAKEHGLEGIFIKTVLELSPTLDEGELKEIKSHADALGLYLDCGVGRVNPYNTAESPNVRILGGGDYRLGIERMIRAARTIDCTELWGEMATSADKKDYAPKFRIDRFRTDVSWEDQLIATEKFLKLLAPILRDLSCRIDVETHEEATSYEVVRLVESVGPDVVGITYDTGNGLLRGEDPVCVARRVAPYTHLTHIKDSILFLNDEGLVRQIRPCGEGVLDWESILASLGKYSPDLHLTLEDHKGLGGIPIFHNDWLDAHPDLSISEIFQLVKLSKLSDIKIASGEILETMEYQKIPFEEQWIDRLLQSSKYLRDTIRKIRL